MSDPILEWAQTHPYNPDIEAAVRAEDERRMAWLRGVAEGAYCVNRGVFEILASLDGRRPLRDVPSDGDAARQLRSRLRRSVDAWNQARWDYEGGRRLAPVFCLDPNFIPEACGGITPRFSRPEVP